MEEIGVQRMRSEKSARARFLWKTLCVPAELGLDLEVLRSQSNRDTWSHLQGFLEIVSSPL